MARYARAGQPVRQFLARGLSDEELKQELFALAAERGLDHAIIVRRIGSRLAKLDWRSRGFGGDGRSSSVEPLIGAYKAFPDGREELVPIAALSTLSESDFRNIVNVSEATTRHDTGFSPAVDGGRTGFATRPVSVVTPALAVRGRQRPATDGEYTDAAPDGRILRRKVDWPQGTNTPAGFVRIRGPDELLVVGLKLSDSGAQGETRRVVLTN